VTANPNPKRNPNLTLGHVTTNPNPNSNLNVGVALGTNHR